MIDKENIKKAESQAINIKDETLIEKINTNK